MKKEDLKIDAWMKELAPTTELRHGSNHDPERWEESCKRYFKEIQKNEGSVSELLETAGRRPILLLYVARDQQHNQAVALKQGIDNHASKSKT